jgi:hypothetical protein
VVVGTPVTGVLGTGADPAGSPLSPTPGPVTDEISQAVAALDQATAAGEIPSCLVRRLLPEAALSVLFWVRGEQAIACSAHPSARTLAELQQLVVSLSEPSLMQWARRLESPVRSFARGDAVQHKVAEYCGVEKVGESCVLPVAFNGKVVNLLCVLSAEGTRLPEETFQLMRPVIEAAGTAYTRIARALCP